jgi:hypothetical protein
MLLTDLPNDQPRTPGESVIVPPMLRNPKDTRTEAAAVTFPPPRTPDFWKNREFTFTSRPLPKRIHRTTNTTRSRVGANSSGSTARGICPQLGPHGGVTPPASASLVEAERKFYHGVGGANYSGEAQAKRISGTPAAVFARTLEGGSNAIRKRDLCYGPGLRAAALGHERAEVAAPVVPVAGDGSRA